MHDISSMKSLYMDSMDSEKDIEMAAVKLMMDTKLPRIELLKMILGRYQIQRRSEEAVIVQRLIGTIQAGEIWTWVVPKLLIKQ